MFMMSEELKLEYKLHGEYSLGYIRQIKGVDHSLCLDIIPLLSSPMLSFFSLEPIQDEIRERSSLYKYLLCIRVVNTLHIYFTNNPIAASEVSRYGQCLEEVIEIEIKAHISITNYNIFSLDANDVLKSVFSGASICGLPLSYSQDNGIISIKVPVKGDKQNLKAFYCIHIQNIITCLGVYGDFGIWIKKFSFSEKKRNGFDIEIGSAMRCFKQFDVTEVSNMLKKLHDKTYANVLRYILESNNSQTEYGRFIPLYLALKETFSSDQDVPKLLNKECRQSLRKSLNESGINDAVIQRILSVLGKLRLQTEDELLAKEINSKIKINTTTKEKIKKLRELRNKLSHENTRCDLSPKEFTELLKHVKAILVEYYQIPLAV